MAKQVYNNVKLGGFVLGGLFFLVLLLYMIGKNHNLFGSTYVLKARFENIKGLVPGNNVRFAGIDAGTVKGINIINDSVIEVSMVLDKKMLTIIRKNALASIGTEGLVGNKVVNIVPSREPGEFATEGDLLVTGKGLNTDEILQRLNKTNEDIAVIADELKSTILRINSSSALWSLLNDESLPRDLKLSVANIHASTVRALAIANSLNEMVMDTKNGKGSVGALLTDTSFAQNLNEVVLKMKQVGNESDSLLSEMTEMVNDIRQDVNTGNGTVHALLKDSSMTSKLNLTLDHLEKGTENFNQDMEALKHSFLLRGYFKKLEKEKKKSMK